MKFPRWLAVLAAVLVVAGGGLYWLFRPPEKLTVASWGEAYGRAQLVAQIHPFADKAHVDVDSTIYVGGLKEIRAQVASGHIGWDVVDLELDDAAAACRDGLLENLAGTPWPPGINGRQASDDFVPGALGPCWVGSAVYSQIVAYDPDRFATPPARIADFFDLAHFPGKRGLRDGGPKYNLEFALLADGVDPRNVYRMLATPEGVDRAFAKLDTIKASIVWWRKVNDALPALASGDVAMTTVLNGRVFAADADGEPVSVLWDGQLYEQDVFGILKGTAHKKQALAFLRFATSAEPLAVQARWVPYGPSRRSAIALVGDNPQTGVTMRPFLPTAPENFRNALAVDPDWWAAHGAALAARWTAWRKS